jgi:hypothetical protein
VQQVKQIRYIGIVLATVLVLINIAFINDKSDTEYGLISASVTDNKKYKYTVVDLKVLDSLKTLYSCDLGGSFCQVSLEIDTAKTIKWGSHYEIIEFEFDPSKVEYSGAGFHFSFEFTDKVK